LSSQAQVIKTRLPNPPPSVPVLLANVHAALEELKAKDVVEIDVRGKSSVADYLVIASGTSTRHVKSSADEVVKFAKKLDVMPLGVEGEREAEWVLVDRARHAAARARVLRVGAPVDGRRQSAGRP
jgi:ribosome-associated protein